MTLDPEKVADLVRACARNVVMPAFRNLETIEIGLKGPNDYVTAADVAAEAFLTPELQALLPGSVVVGEETAGDEAAWRRTLETAEAVWLIDPIDGTANFAAGIPLFGIMVALVEHGQTTHAWIHDPNTGEMGMAQAGAGAWVGGHRSRVSAAPAATAMRGSLNTRFAPEEEAALLFRASRRLPPTLDVCAAVQAYLYVATGRTDYVLFHKLFPWDHAAGVLLHAEAGGHARHRDGTPYAPHGPARGNSMLLTPDAASWRDLYAVLYET
jgi:fructose-1,6-bisphosphatase/inositol monophosphatase family enzyme